MCLDSTICVSGRTNEHYVEGQSLVEILQANSLEKAKLASLAPKHGTPRDQSTDNG
ncbi:hypothetical protein PITC_094030 [Penicillium italicum]|uniref:Uncharacterized protein n=1 Tax=Penicillium italicum TaxID=40296 RepID=A0A0A2KCB2_PENIT|nr:hypothetical protein PITC_094030 [Penicillium italicum]